MSKQVRTARWALCSLALLATACSDDGASNGNTATLEELMNPKTCEKCHSKHFKEWSSSMHAYAAQDPVFLAMNARGQRETNDELGDFCVNCHAPMAVREGLTTNGLNLDEVPDHMEGVTCYFCHNVVEVTGTHNAALELANDTTMRGGIMDPVSNKAHGAEYSTLHDSDHTSSSKLCGACHDIVTTPKEVELERTFQEWRESVHATPGTGFQSCGHCHMSSVPGIAADDPEAGVVARDVHEHLWPGVDVALTDFPDTDVQLAAIRCALQNFVLVQLCPDPGHMTVRLEANAGHKWPSGAAQDRRAWVELIAYDADDQVLFSTGQIADDEIVDKPEGEPGHDLNLWVMRDRIFDDEGNETHMFWEAASFESLQLPTAVPMNPTHDQVRTFTLGIEPERVELRVKIRPMDFDVLQDLVDSKDLDPRLLERIQTFTLESTEVHWSRSDGYTTCVGPVRPSPDVALDCPNDYRCRVDPNGPGCEDWSPRD